MFKTGKKKVTSVCVLSIYMFNERGAQEKIKFQNNQQKIGQIPKTGD
jgi:hypothetical protein